MDPVVISIAGVVVLLLLMSQGMPIGFSFAIVGLGGVILVRGLTPGLNLLGSAAYQYSSPIPLIPMPLFILMGSLVFYSAISSDLYAAAYKWVGRLPGGLAIATTLAGAGFGACCGSTVAGAATMASIGFPEMQRFNYNRGFSTGSIASIGTLTIMIPPSTGFILYGFLTETSIAELFIAGILPGLLLAGLFVITILLSCLLNPGLGAAGESFRWREMFISLRGVTGALCLFILVVGGLWIGIFTPSEAGAIGAFGALVLGLASRRLTFSKIFAALKDSLQVTCFTFMIVVGAMIFNVFLATCGFATIFGEFMNSFQLPPMGILVIILLIYIPIGMFMDSLAMLFLLLPIVFPVIKSLGFDPVWFGILITLEGEIAAITPPIGINVYVVQGMTKVPMEEIFWGTVPFFGAMVVCMILLVAFPQISLFLPGMMK